MKTVTQTAQINFRADISRLKALTGMNNIELGKLLGCSDQTISNIYKNPLTASGKYVLLIQEYLRREEKKIYD